MTCRPFSAKKVKVIRSGDLYFLYPAAVAAPSVGLGRNERGHDVHL